MTAGAVGARRGWAPYEAVKTKLMDGNAGRVRGIANIVRAEGLRGVYQGWGPTVAKQSSNQGLRFMAFSSYKDAMLAREACAAELHIQPGLQPLAVGGDTGRALPGMALLRLDAADRQHRFAGHMNHVASQSHRQQRVFGETELACSDKDYVVM